MLQLALVQLCAIRRAGGHPVSQAGRARYPEIPWGQAITTRHRMVHDYDRIDYYIVWDTIAEDSRRW